MKNKIKNAIKNRGLINVIVLLFVEPFRRALLIVIKPILKAQKTKKIIVFESMPDFDGNSKLMYEYYMDNSDYNFVWFITDKKKKKQIQKNPRTRAVVSETKRIVGYSIRAYYYMFKAEMLYCDHMQKGFSERKSNQLAINLWHGCGYKDNYTKNSLNWFDYALVPGELFINTKAKFWNCPKEKIIPIGYPSYDPLKTECDRKKSTLKTIVWMPTFRKTKNGTFIEESYSSDYDMPLLKNENELNDLNKKCKEEKLQLIIKRHPNQVKYSSEDKQYSNIVFESNESLKKKKITISELLQKSDALISDYSSVSVDYLLLDRPIAYTMDDYEQYKNTRGFVFKNPKDYMPGVFLNSYTDLIEFIEAIANGRDGKACERKAMRKIMHNPTDNYCERIYNFAKKEAERKNEK